MARVSGYDPGAPGRVPAVSDFSQDLVDLWRGPNSEVRGQILESVRLNHTISDASLCLAKRKPFDFLAERPF
jgi:hypothetical protein